MQPTPEGNARGDALGALQALANSVDGLRQGVIDDAEQRRRETAAADRQRRRSMRVVLAAVVAAVLLLGGLMTVTVQNNRISKQNGDLAVQVADCTTNQQGECYKTGQQRTRKALEQIRLDGIRTSIYVHQCAKVTQTDADLEECVLRKLKNPEAQWPPSPEPQPPIETPPPNDPSPAG